MTPAEFASPNFRYREHYQGCKGKAPEGTLAMLEASGRWVAEPKRDGIWCVAFFDDTGVQFFSRTQELKLYSLDKLVVPPLFGCAIVGELGFGSQESRRRRAAYGHDFMDWYDIIAASGQHVGGLRGPARRAWLEDLHERVVGWNRDVAKRFILTPRWRDRFEERYAAEPEGLILKLVDDEPYEGGGVKVERWLKAKKDHTVDYVVMGYEESTAETKAGKGLVEHLVCGAYVDGVLTALTKTGGMTHEMQQDVVKNWETGWLNHVVELKHFGRFRSGALRHPSVVRLRDDKKPEQCIFNPEEISPSSFKTL